MIEVIERLREERGLPERVICDNGSEFTSRAFDAWAYSRDLKIEYIQPGKPIQNCFVESFLGSFRDECLKLHWVPLPTGCEAHDRTQEAGLQSRPTPQRPGRSPTCGLRPQPPHGVRE